LKKDNNRSHIAVASSTAPEVADATPGHGHGNQNGNSHGNGK